MGGRQGHSASKQELNARRQRTARDFIVYVSLV